ncbi:TIM-barrel domain-containing protein [Streptomyces sp. V4-01]|uniref:TIM-barrel domain-containing protein n=1 Tax=Actinacidiphila polyblastidii TaxID=3110430 RepID=A0ABU7PJ57_9ACTN|nr:TIM-barrel domain-containing protein [Streptomyces sp. V4-01]
MEPEQIKRRTLLTTAVGVLAAGAVTSMPGRAAAAAAQETLADYSKHTSDARSVTVTSTTGQQLRLTAYGDQIVRVHATRAGETFFADTRYEMVVPGNHTSMGGTLSVTATSDTLELHTAAADGLRVVLHKKPLRLEFYARDTGALLAKEDSAHGVSWSGTNSTIAAQAFAAPPSDERFLKAGHGILGRTPKIDRTGDTVSHNYADAAQAADNPNDQAPAIVPFYLSSKGYGVFFNTTFDTTFTFGGTNGYGFSADGHNAGGAQPQLDYFLINGPRFAQLLDRYTQLTGRPRLPQQSIFGLHMSDHSFPDVSDQNWWQSKITQHRSAGFPFDHQVNDNRWRNGTGGWSGSWFEFSPDRWPDPAGYEKWAVANGVTVTLDYNRNNTNLMENWKGGPPPGGYSLAASDLTNVANNKSVPDWTNPATRAWVWKVFWDKALNPSLAYPCDGLWIDETDDVGAIPYTAKMADGRTWAENRNAYILNLHKGVGQEGWDPSGSGHIGAAKRPWTWSRGATAGQQRYGHYWTGDISSTYDEMKNQIRGMQTAGLGGFPFANIDGGGYGNGNADSDAFYRNWPVAWSSLAPIWRPHTSATVPSKGKKASRWPLDQSAQAQADFAKYGQLRYSLMPYVYTLAHQAGASGLPMARAMVIDYQNRPQAYTHDLQYMWGPSLLVAPLLSDGGAVQQVWLPAGTTWYNFWADIKHAGTDSGDFAYTTRTGETPLFVKAGAILPKYPYAQSTAYFNKRQLELEVYAGADGAFDLVEDDSVTEAYRSGRTSVTHLAYTDAATRVVVSHPQGTYDGAPDRRRYVVRFHGLAAAVGMRVNGGATLPAFTSEAAVIANGSGAGCVWDAQAKVLSVVTAEIAVGSNGTAATIEPSGAAFPAVSAGTVYQAETARLDDTFVIDTLHPGYTGTGYADFNGTSAGATLAWTVTTATAGQKQLRIRYANGSGDDRPVTIDVNGTKGATLALSPTGSWDTWATATCTATLPQGANITVRATLTKSTGANIDSLSVL